MIERAPATELTISDKMLNIFSNEEALALVSKIHEEYYYWTKIKQLPIPEPFDATDIWSMVKLNRCTTAKRIHFGPYRFNWCINNRLQELLHFLDLNIGGTLESTHSTPKEDKNRYLISSIMEEAIASSQIEGAVTTRKSAKEMLRKNEKPRNKSDQMIINNYRTIQKILEIKGEPLTKENFLAVHKLVTANTLANPAEEGAYRKDNDVNVHDTATGEVVHHPPDTDELDVLLNDLFCFFNDEDKNDFFIHPIIKACIIHFMVGFIHPFADGNGRTARALFYWYLLKKGYWLTEYLSISRLILRAKAQYARAFQYTEIDGHDLTYFILFNLRTMKLAFEDLRKYIQRKNEEKRQLTNFMGIDGISYRQSQILEWFYNEPTLLLTVNETQNRSGVSNQTARTDLKELADKGYLDEMSINKVAKGYVKGRNFEILQEQVKRAAKSKLKYQLVISNQHQQQTKLF